MRQGIWSQGTRAENKLGAPRENPFAGHCGAQGRRVSPARQGRRRQGRRAVDEDAAPGIDDQGRSRGDLGRPPHSDDPARQLGRACRAASTSPGFWARSTNIGTNWARCWSPPSSFSCLLSLRHYSFRSSSTRFWSIAASSTLDVLVIGLLGIAAFRDHSWHPADIPVFARHQPDRRRTRRAAVPTSAGVAHGLFSGPPGRRFGRARARTGKHPDFLDQFGADAGDRSVLHLRLPRRDASFTRRC